MKTWFTSVALVVFLMGILLIDRPTLAQEETSPGSVLLDPPPEGAEAKLEKIRQTLREKKITIDVEDMPLNEFAQLLSREIGAPVDLDTRALEDVALSKDVPVTAHFQDISIESVLSWELEELDLAFLLSPDGVLITTPVELETELVTRAYDISDLIDDRLIRPRDIAEILIMNIDYDSWEYLGGPGSVGFWPNQLVILQTDANHQSIEQALNALRTLKQLPSDPYPTKPIAYSRWETEQEEVIRRLDNTEVTLKFENTPLEEAISKIEELGGFPIQINERELEALALSKEMPVNLPKGKRTLRRTLDLICHPLDLAWHQPGEFLVVSTGTDVETELVTRFYPVRDLVWHSPKPANPADIERLLDLSRWQGAFVFRETAHLSPLQVDDYGALPGHFQLRGIILTSVRPYMWEDLGGPGSCQLCLELDCLAIMQTRRVHEEVSVLLHRLRQNPATFTIEDQLRHVEQANAEVVTVRYPVPKTKEGERKNSAEEMQAVAKMIASSIEPESWQGSGNYVLSLHDHLVVRNRREVLHQVHDRLVELEVTVPPIPEYDVLNESLSRVMGGGSSYPF